MKNFNFIQKLNKRDVLFIIVSLILLGITIIPNFLKPETVSLPEGQSLSDISKNSTNNYTSSSITSQENSQNQLESDANYLVTIKNNEICVFKDDEPLPLEHDVVPVSSLNFTDKALLQKGIYFSTHNDMINFLQNYE